MVTFGWNNSIHLGREDFRSIPCATLPPRGSQRTRGLKAVPATCWFPALFLETRCTQNETSVNCRSLKISILYTPVECYGTRQNLPMRGPSCNSCRILSTLSISTSLSAAIHVESSQINLSQINFLWKKFELSKLHETIRTDDINFYFQVLTKSEIAIYYLSYEPHHNENFVWHSFQVSPGNDGAEAGGACWGRGILAKVQQLYIPGQLGLTAPGVSPPLKRKVKW